MEDREVWSELPGYSDYLVSDYGQVYNMRKKYILNGGLHTAGYVKVRLYNEERTREFYIHHLVALCFLNDYRQGMQIRHIDGIRTNNHLTNLKLIKTKRSGGLTRKPKYVRGSKVLIIETGDVFINAYACARFVEGDVSSIYKCLRGERSQHMGYRYEYIE